MNNHQIEYTAT